MSRDFTLDIRELNDFSIPMVDTHFYQWLGTEAGRAQEGDLNKVRAYLRTLGWVEGDTLEPYTLRALRYICEEWWYLNELPEGE